MFSRDEMQRAIEDALKSMEGVALELYRRGREEAREELETVKRERDEARASCPDCAMWAERSARWHDDMQRAERERDEARADAERCIADLRRCASEPYEHAKERAEAYRRGAEAMREACAQWFREHDESFELTVDACHDVIADMPIPEEP